MRRRGIMLLAIVIVAAALVATWTVAYRAGESDGRAKISTDRSVFQTRIASAPQTGSGQAAGAGGAPGAAGGGGGAAGTRGPGGSAVASGGGQAGGAPSAAGTPAAGRGSGAAGSLVGKVTKVDGSTLSVTQSDNSTVSVTTTADTAIRKLVAGALTDLKTGDLVMVDGSKTGDTAYSAKSVTGLGSPTGGGAGRAPGGGPPSGTTASALVGQIKSLDGATMMVQGFDGTTVTVTTTAATVVRTQQPGTLSDIKSGDTLLIQGDKTGETAFLARTITNQGASP